jgi:glycine/D-amino acid oxidase-like deaminating enzyme
MLPADDSRCGWYAMHPAPPPARRLRGRERADTVVLGAGITGLSAARRLAEHLPDSRILLVEAQRVGFGASGRNSGFLTDLGHHDPRLTPDQKRRRIQLARFGIDRMREQVRAHDIPCDWREGGRLHGATSDAGLRALERFLHQLEELGEPHDALDTGKLQAITGTDYYRAGAHLPGSVLVQPVSLVRGLADALPPNVELYEDSPVRTIERGTPLRLECAEGSIEAERLLLATNAFAPELGFLRSRMFPLLIFASLTRVLSEAEQEALGGEREWGLVPEIAVGTSVRRTSDQRLLIRNGANYIASGRATQGRFERVRAAHANSLRERWPEISGVELEYTWAGTVAISLNEAPFFGRLSPNVLGAGIFNGVGMAAGAAAGTLLADLAVGADSELLRDAQSLPQASWHPPRPLLGLGVPPALAWLQYQARAEI